MNMNEAKKIIEALHKVFPELTEQTKPKQLQDFSKTLANHIIKEMSHQGTPLFTIDGQLYTSLYDVTETLGWLYTSNKWSVLKKASMQGVFKLSHNHGPNKNWIDTDTGRINLRKYGCGNTLCIRIADVETIFLEAQPRKNKKLLDQFKAKHSCV